MVSASLRYICCKHIFKYCGKGVGVERLAFFGSGRNIIIGDRSNLGINCKVPSDICIGQDVMMGPNFCCQSTNHKFDRIDIPMNQQGISERAHLCIGSDVWIGQDVLMLPGGDISDGCVIAARSIVTRKLPPYTVCGGVPCKVIKYRK